MTTYGPSAYDYEYLPAPEQAPVAYPSIEELPLLQREYVDRSPWLAVPFLFTMVLCGVSWLSNGISLMTDIGMLVTALSCLAFLTAEFVAFPKRFGIGGLMILGGFLVWISYDYNDNWFGRNFDTDFLMVPSVIVAKAAFFHCMFLFFAIIGLRITFPKFTDFCVNILKEPNWDGFYMCIVLVTFIVGIAPYQLWTNDGLIGALSKSMFAGRSGSGAEWTVGRSGNANVNWGGYIIVLMKMGAVGAQFAVFYALIGARTMVAKITCWSIWGLHFALAFGSGTRGEVAFMGLPVLAVLFLKRQLTAVVQNKALSLRAYMFGAVVLVGIVVSIQFQATFRNEGFKDADFSSVDVLKLKGNTMFTEGLAGWYNIPDRRGFFANSFPGEGMVRAIPQTFYNFIVHGIPRALWTTKPVDQLGAWYNALVTGRREDQTEGTTISTGLIGEWYFRYGVFGVIEGGLLFGVMARITETVLLRGNMRPMSTLFAVGLCVWLFRCYRNFFFGDLYPLLIGTLFLVILVRLNNMNAAKA